MSFPLVFQRPAAFSKILGFLLVFLSLTASLQALQVKKIDPKSQEMTLDDGKTFRLAGLRLTEEAPKVMAIMFSKSEIQYDEEKQLAKEGFPPSVYVFLKTSEIDFPASGNSAVREPRIFLNELLLAHGLATVDESAEFPKKESFLKFQEQAKLSGMGFWSQEPPKKK